MSFAPSGALSRVSIVMGRDVYRRARAGSQVEAVLVVREGAVCPVVRLTA
jgi:hypothetical protein